MSELEHGIKVYYEYETKIIGTCPPKYPKGQGFRYKYTYVCLSSYITGSEKVDIQTR